MSLLQDYPFESHHQDVSGVKIHYLDEGDKGAPAIIFLHGVPTWSYTFRKIIPACVSAGYRAIVPDLPGFGFSDKPVPEEIFSLPWLVQIMGEFLNNSGVDRPVLFAHDWGGVIGLILAARDEDLFSGIILCNSLLPVPGMKAPLIFRAWRFFSRFSPVLPIGTIVDLASNRRLSRNEKRNYSHPFGSGAEKGAVRIMPRLLPFGKKHPGHDLIEKSWSGLERWNKPILTMFSDGDPITRGGDKLLRERIPGARNLEPLWLHGGHFVQEDAPEEISRGIIGFMEIVS